MSGWFHQDNAAWIWLVLGLALCAVEVVAPGAFMIWFGAAAIVVGLLSFVIAPPLSAALILFAVLATGFALFGRRFYGGGERREAIILNDRARGLIGRVGVLDMQIGAEPGKLRLDDTQWRAKGPELPSGARVKVTGVAADGSTLLVEAA